VPTFSEKSYVFFFKFLFYFKNLFFSRIARALPLWAKIVMIGTVCALVAGGAIGAGVYFAIHGQYFHFNSDTKDVGGNDHFLSQNVFSF
jgi:hypothetical protein